jgi:hypothetical protein
VILFASSFWWLAGVSLVGAVVFALSTINFLWTTRRGKFIVWGELLDALALRGDEVFSTWDAVGGWFSYLLRSAYLRDMLSASTSGRLPTNRETASR